MPVPYVDVGSDIMKAWMTGRQTAMAMQQIQMERARLTEEKRMHDMENAHFIQTQAHLEKSLAQTHEYQLAEMKRQQALTDQAQKVAQFGEKQGVLGDVAKGNISQTPYLPTPDSGANDVQFAQNAAAAPAPTATPLQLPPTAGVSPADQTQQTINQSPTSSEAIAGNGPVAGPAPVVNQMQQPSQGIVTPSGANISPQEIQQVRVAPAPMSEEAKLSTEHTNRMTEQKAQIDAENAHWQKQYALESQRVELERQRYHEEMQLRHDLMGNAVQTKVDSIADKVANGSTFQKQLQNYGPLMDYMTKLTAKDENGKAGNTSGMEDAQAMNRLNVMISGTPLAGLTRVKEFADSLKTTPENLGNKIRQLTSSGNALLSPQQKRELGLLIHDALKNTNQDYVMRFNAAAQQMKNLHFQGDPSTITPYSGILYDFEDKK